MVPIVTVQLNNLVVMIILLVDWKNININKANSGNKSVIMLYCIIWYKRLSPRVLA